MSRYIALYKAAKTYKDRANVVKQARGALSVGEYAIFFNIVSKLA